MRGFMVLPTFLAVLSVPSSVFAQRAPDPERDAVVRVITHFAERIQANDLSAIDSLFPRRGVHILTDSATTHGWAEFRDKYLKPELSRFQDPRYTHSAVEVVVRNNVAWAAFRRELSSGNGGAGPLRGRGTAVLEKIDGRWTIVHLHVSN